MTCGVYKIENLVDGKAYIGSSRNAQQRWKKHLYLLRRNEHNNQELQQAFNKHGEFSFVFAILQESKEVDLKTSEQGFIAQYQANGLAYNVRAKPSGRRGTEEGRVVKSFHLNPETPDLLNKLALSLGYVYGIRQSTGEPIPAVGEMLDRISEVLLAKPNLRKD